MSLSCLACREPLCPHLHCTNLECRQYRADDVCMEIDRQIDERTRKYPHWMRKETEPGMTKSEAMSLIEQVKREEPRITASIENNSKDRRGNGCRVRLELPSQKLIMYINDMQDWKSVKHAWSHWLPGLVVEQVRASPRKRTYFLVDGIPMCFYRDKNGYWHGAYSANGKQHKRYFGIVDPRGRYPQVEHRNERQEQAV